MPLLGAVKDVTAFLKECTKRQFPLLFIFLFKHFLRMSFLREKEKKYIYKTRHHSLRTVHAHCYKNVLKFTVPSSLELMLKILRKKEKKKKLIKKL